MTVRDLKCVLEDLPDDMPVHIAFDGTTDEQPTYYVDDNLLYLEGTR